MNNPIIAVSHNSARLARITVNTFICELWLTRILFWSPYCSYRWTTFDCKRFMPNNYFSLLFPSTATDRAIPSGIKKKNNFNRANFEKLSLLTSTCTLTINTCNLQCGNPCLFFEEGSYLQPSGIPYSISVKGITHIIENCLQRKQDG